MKVTRSHHFLLAFALLLVMFVFTGYQYIYTPNIQVEKEDTHLYITKGTTFKKLLRFVTDEGIVTDPISFGFIAKVMHYQENIKPGKFLLQKNMTNIEAIRYLRQGGGETEKIQFSQARKLEDVLGKICRPILADSAKTDELIHSQQIIEDYGFEKETLIAMFIPNTYEVFWHTDEQALLDRIKKEYDRFWNEERKSKANKLGLSTIQVSTLASIVQAETYQKDEKPMVAGLYLNRLRQGIMLQADPTLIYALNDYSIKRVLNEHKEVESPYNTYKHVGLPPGPINLPSISSIDAVLNAVDHEYIFMCAKGDCSGYHNFAKTNSEHNRNRVIYRKNLNKEGGC